MRGFLLSIAILFSVTAFAQKGGKAAYLYYSLKALEENVNFLANEPVPHRAELVKRVISNDLVLSLDGTVAENFTGKFDRILVDAPCTGLGALRRRPEARWRRTQNDLKELVKFNRVHLRPCPNRRRAGCIIRFRSIDLDFPADFFKAVNVLLDRIPKRNTERLDLSA